MNRAGRTGHAVKGIKMAMGDYIDPSGRIDSATGTVLLERELTHIDPEIYKRAKPDPVMLDLDDVPGVPAGASNYEYNIMTAVGVATIVANYATDIPIVNAAVEPHIVKLHSFKEGVVISEDDMLAYATAKRPIDQTLMDAALDGVDVAVEETLWLGDAASCLKGVRYGMHGMISHPNVPRFVFPFRLDGSESFTTDQVLAAFSKLLTTMNRLTRNVEKPNRLALPDHIVTYLGLLKMDTASGYSVLSWFLENVRKFLPDFQIVSVHWLIGAGAGTTDAGVLYRAGGTQIHKLYPMKPRRQPTVYADTVYKTHYWARFGGLVVRRPFSMLIIDGL